MNKTPIVSVVIPTRGRALLLKRAIESVLAQTFQDFEIVVVVDGRDEETEKILGEIPDPRLKTIINEHSLGGAEARNVGVRHARGEWIALLDDDDEWLPRKLEVQYQAARQSSYRYPVVYCQLFGRTPRGDYIWPRRGMKENEHISEYLMARQTLFQGEGLIISTMLFVPRDLMLQVPFQKDLKRNQDWDWILRAALHEGVGFEYCEEVLAVWYVEDGRQSISRQGNWEYSARWIKQNKSLVTPRAYAAYLMVVVSSIAAREGDRKGLYQIFREAISNGKPALIDILLFFGIWIIPQETRRKLRSLIQLHSK
ncbi:glycosyltransferase family 2 protein [Lihuaxuella thermophila]|uniref:Glycosyltransferase involved in cell wall bisynthesis n=1 Tax=Lihuaxuella thermophila TaxID=1173111 RepID=A0A1H8CES5_9BACL|nr:glycosyltransferase family 2 protein [Lihuaxuella thermophila]SEM93516.1 Glycosyltransferase involved in cell wall bisynthesis [Lihuaxuella thermophila]